MYRVAAYYAPEPDDPLAAAGNSWLGRDPATGAELPQPDLPDLPVTTAEARRYGFHATLKPPMRLRPEAGWADFLAAATALAARIAPFALPPLEVADLSGFLALQPTGACPALQAFCDRCVEGLDAYRAPPSAAELERRRRHGMSPAREAMLRRWGYPDVFAEWRFHMTLTRRLRPEEQPRYAAAAARHFTAALRYPRQVRSLCLFVQSAPEAPLLNAARLPLLGRAPPAGPP